MALRGITSTRPVVRLRPLAGAALAVLLLSSPVGAQPMTDAFPSAARAVLPAVVTITIPSETVGPDLDGEEGIPESELLRGLLGEAFGGSPRQAVAAGVILDLDGLVLTTARAVREVADIEATTVDGLTHKATIVGLDRKTDLAVLRLGGLGPFRHASLGNSDAVRTGDWVVAIGAPYGLGATVTAGIISATARARPIAPVDDLLQTDATTFPDSAGGPLVNVRGEVIGFTTVLATSQFGIGFAVPSNTARKIFLQLAREGVVARGSLDARVQRLTPGLAKAFGTPDRLGLLVADVPSAGSAARAGLRVGDILVTLDGKRLEVPYDLERALRESVPAQTLAVTYWRTGQVHASPVTLGRERDEVTARPFTTRAASMLRFEVRPITPEMGVVVTHVRPDRAMAEARVRPGDVIREIDHQPVRTLSDFERFVDHLKPGDWLAILVQRGRLALYVAVVAGSAM